MSQTFQIIIPHVLLFFVYVKIFNYIIKKYNYEININRNIIIALLFYTSFIHSIFNCRIHYLTNIKFLLLLIITTFDIDLSLLFLLYLNITI
jgi:hypothetical protein